MTGPPVDVPAEDAVPDGVIMDGISAEQEKIIESSKESFVFQAEVNRLMDIIINSLCKFLHIVVILFTPGLIF